jgi:hypothetical protein
MVQAQCSIRVFQKLEVAFFYPLRFFAITMLPSRRNRQRRTPRAAATISFTSHDWSAPTSRSSRQRPRSAIGNRGPTRRNNNNSNNSVNSNNSNNNNNRHNNNSNNRNNNNNNTEGGSFGMDNLIELKRLKKLDSSFGHQRRQQKQDTNSKAHTKTAKEENAVINNTIRKLRQVYENKHSLRES